MVDVGAAPGSRPGGRATTAWRDRLTRSAAAAAIGALGALALAAGPASAARGRVPGKPKPAATGQRAILAAKHVTVAIAGRRGDRVRLTATLTEHGHRHALSSPRTVRFAKTGRLKVSLPVSAAGRRSLSACTPAGTRLVVEARAVGAHHRLGRRVSVSVALHRDTARCAAPKPPAGQPAPPKTSPPTPPSGTTPPAGGDDTPPADEPTVPAIDVSRAGRCDFLTASDKCLLPFPNDYFTVADSATATGRRLNLDRESMPANVDGVHIDPTDFNRADGFSPGSGIVVKVPGLDTPAAFANTGSVPITDEAQTYDNDTPIVVIDASTGKRQLIWTELDANADTPADTDLEIHPAVNFTEGHRYIVAMRDLKDADGTTLQPADGFRVYRDKLITDQDVVEARRDHMEDLFSTLHRAGIARDDLYLAWDFTVASAQSLSSRMLSMRDQAFADLGDTDLSDLTVQGSAPQFTVTSTTDFQPCGTDGCQSGEDANVARRVQGTFQVPCFLTHNCAPGGELTLDGDGAPTETGGTFTAKFVCNIPWVAVDGDGTDVTPARPTLYGHGLFGSASEVTSTHLTQFADEQNFVNCATDWIGMSSSDVPTVAGAILPDLSNMPMLADRAQQGMLDFLYLGRLMIHPDGFDGDPAFQFTKHGVDEPIIDRSHLYYTGGSQGGIMGGALTAVAPDFTRAYLGVPGMNYSVLLPRSSDFDEFAPYLYGAYPDQGDHPLLFTLMELLWDRGEADGYAQHMTSDPLPGTPAHTVLLQMAYGDHQVTNYATEVEIRTIGAKIRTPILDPGRSPFVTPFYGIEPITSYPYSGSAVSVWDVGPLRDVGGVTKGTPSPPIENKPNREGVDPHGPDASEQVTGRAQVGHFLNEGGSMIDTCGSAPCYLDGYTGPPAG